ncbi:hypothetical protein BZG02_08170 [Labilibaculum filiforme]|uniref:Uncharacterized protein n=1 Tax=Labilibaculum filiforme TaxID=1940526 RepID=A0A2N3I0Y2_9BACT|nr:hypothetical protein [Labilibaculum filiforme]PKQ63978.1 hypothetical protein BZG02_08170 [Labilibaculum filiforme]
MGKEAKKKVVKIETYESLKAMYYSGRVKPSLNKIIVALEKDPENLALLLLACQCLERTKDIDTLCSYADAVIKLDSKIAAGYYFKGVALQNTKGKEQEALKNFNEALLLDPENTIYLKSKASTHFSLYTDYHLPLQFAEKHRVKTEESLFKVVELIEGKENPDYQELLTIADVLVLLSKGVRAKRYYIQAVDAYTASEASNQDKNIYKDIIKAQNACIKLLDKNIEDV